MKNQITIKPAAAIRKTAVVVCLTLLFGALYPAMQSGVSAQTPSNRAASSEGGGQKEGIKVHGHWTIEVRNPDGTLIARREFENALTPEGATTLALVLGLKNMFGEWGITLKGDTNANQPCAFQDLGSGQLVPIPCLITPPDLQVDVPSSGQNANKLVITGQTTAKRDGNISAVETSVGRCDLNAPSCSGKGVRFTATPLRDATGQPTTLPLTAGRIIQVTVLISFS